MSVGVVRLSVLAPGMGNSVMVPPVVTRAIWSWLDSATQTFPSGPATIPKGSAAGVGRVMVVAAPAGVAAKIVLSSSVLTVVSANHKLPSGPVAILPKAGLPVPGSGWLEMTPAGVMEARYEISLVATTANQTFPSGPFVIPVVTPSEKIPVGRMPAGNVLKKVTAPLGVIRPICWAVNQRLPSEPAV